MIRRARREACLDCGCIGHEQYPRHGGVDRDLDNYDLVTRLIVVVSEDVSRLTALIISRPHSRKSSYFRIQLRMLPRAMPGIGFENQKPRIPLEGINVRVPGRLLTAS